jgi:hypothetical protein
VNLAINCGSLSETTTQGPIVFPDLSKEEESCIFGIDSGMHRDKVCALGYAIDNIHNCIISMGFRQFDYEVHADYIPWCLRCLQRVGLTDRSLSLHLHLVAQL